MDKVFWKVWALLLVLSIFWLGWAIKTSDSAKAGPEVFRVDLVSVGGLPVFNEIPVSVRSFSGEAKKALKDSLAEIGVFSIDGGGFLITDERQRILANLRTIASAQASFCARNGHYATAWEELANPKDGRALLDVDWIDGAVGGLTYTIEGRNFTEDGKAQGYVVSVTWWPSGSEASVRFKVDETGEITENGKRVSG